MPQHDVIAVGGSAGALEPLIDLLAALPGSMTTPIAIVIHVTPTQPNHLADLLARGCERPVREAEDKEPLAQRTVYVAPSNYHMLLERNSTIALSVDDPVRFSRPSIDVLFESAADAFGPRCAGVVLSGANDDGARGLARIRDRGGLALVQANATYPTMPTAALQLVSDARALSPRELAAYLSRGSSL